MARSRSGGPGVVGRSKKEPGKSPPCMFSLGVADMARDQHETTLSYIIDAQLPSVPKREILSAGEEFIRDDNISCQDTHC